MTCCRLATNGGQAMPFCASHSGKVQCNLAYGDPVCYLLTLSMLKCQNVVHQVTDILSDRCLNPGFPAFAYQRWDVTHADDQGVFVECQCCGSFFKLSVAYMTHSYFSSLFLPQAIADPPGFVWHINGHNYQVLASIFKPITVLARYADRNIPFDIAKNQTTVSFRVFLNDLPR